MSDRHAGFLTVALVKAGHVDQWATIRPDGKRVVVELRYDRRRDTFRVIETLSHTNGSPFTERETEHTYLSEAHDAFTTLTLKHR